jgi:hypothetical protein
LHQLNKKVSESLKLAINDENKKVEGAVQVLSGLVSIVSGMSSLRNKYGDGHGKNKDFKSLPKRYGVLAAHCASAYINFLLDTHEDRKKKQ